MRLAHGWRITGPRDPAVTQAVRAVPRAMAARLGPCGVQLAERPGFGSRWRRTAAGLEVVVATAGVTPHDVALELLLCLGQALWETTTPAEREAWWTLLGGEIEAGVLGEIDEDALGEKRALLTGRASARSRRRFLRYARASFSATAAEYVHCLWHDVTVRTGTPHLAPRWLRRRLQLMAGWFPPNPGYALFPLQ